ncbi:MAG: type II toxin-antitoxin system RatA family toxin [Rhodospirillaceae bacterium]
MSYSLTRFVPGFTPEHLFDLVIDVERYPSFVPGWEAVRVSDRQDDRYRTEQVVRMKPFRQRVHSQTSFRRPDLIEVTGRGDFLKRFDMRWSFLPQEGGCSVELEVEFGMAAKSLQRLVEQLSRESSHSLIDAFVAEAERRYRDEMVAASGQAAPEVEGAADGRKES